MLFHLSVSAGIDPLGSHISISVFLHELTVAHIVGIGAFKAVTVLILLDGWTIALTILKDALEFRTVGKTGDTLAIGLTVQEYTLYGVTALLTQFATTTLLVRLPLTYITVTVLPYESTLTVLVAIQELTRIFVAIGIFEDARTRTCTMRIVALIHVAVLELELSPSE